MSFDLFVKRTKLCWIAELNENRKMNEIPKPKTENIAQRHDEYIVYTFFSFIRCNHLYSFSTFFFSLVLFLPVFFSTLLCCEKYIFHKTSHRIISHRVSRGKKKMENFSLPSATNDIQMKIHLPQPQRSTTCLRTQKSLTFISSVFFFFFVFFYVFIRFGWNLMLVKSSKW